MIQHEYAHSFTAWITGIKNNPIRIDWGGTGIHNILTLGNIDEDVDYDQALAAGHTTAAAVTAMAGVVIGNGVFYLVARQLLRRPAVAGRPWVLFFLLWYIVHSVGNFFDYVPLRTLAADGDVKNFALASGWSRWWIYAVAGYVTLWAIVDLYQKALPRTLGAAGFGRVRAARDRPGPVVAGIVRLVRVTGARASGPGFGLHGVDVIATSHDEAARGAEVAVLPVGSFEVPLGALPVGTAQRAVTTLRTEGLLLRMAPVVHLCLQARQRLLSLSTRARGLPQIAPLVCERIKPRVDGHAEGSRRLAPRCARADGLPEQPWVRL